MCRNKKFDNLNFLCCLAVKAKTVEEVVKNRPVAGILDAALAVEYKMVEVVEGTGVYWYSHQRAYYISIGQATSMLP